MAGTNTSGARVRVDGKFFRLGEKKFYVKGVTYGPFPPNARREEYPEPEQVMRDFALIRKLGANLLRVYQVPPRWFLDLAEEHELKLLVDVPWQKHRCFLSSEKLKQQAREAVQQAVRACLGHPAVFAFSVVNEIPADIVRWSGPADIEAFIDELISLAKAIDPECLGTFGNFPPTEFLRPRNVDFVCFNIYLLGRKPFENYLARLQMATPKPLVLGEFGVDAQGAGPARQCEVVPRQIEAAFRAGLAGAVVFSFTDDWYVGGRSIQEWSFGLTTQDRAPREVFALVEKAFHTAPHFRLSRYPQVSVVVASYNSARTLKACLDSLVRLNYPWFEVILVDDGSTDNTAEFAELHRGVRYIRQQHQGLSVARNTGIAAASGEIVAFTDADCRADEDWLYYLVAELLSGHLAGVGGHNFLPPEDSRVAAAVMASPGGPAHVMLTDHEAEHIPGCNMAFYKWALEEVGGFDPLFQKAGDDVDICWRLQQRGLRLGFSSGGFVWHYRRSTVPAFLRQQRGYGEAEALLVRKHPEYFNTLGGSLWRGRIYASSKLGLQLRRSIIYHGLFGTGFFQTLYAGEPAILLMLCTSLEYHAVVTLPLFVLAVPFPFLLPVAITSLLLSVGVCVAAAAQADLPGDRRAWWSRPLVALLFFLQPIVRGWARYQGRLSQESMPTAARARLDSLSPSATGKTAVQELHYWSEGGHDRLRFLGSIIAALEEQGWPIKVDAGWSDHDVEVFGNRWSRLQLVTAAEHYSSGRTMYCCRLRTAWSLLAKVTFVTVLGLELLVIGTLASIHPWIWMLLLTLPMLAWFIEQQKHDVQALIAVFLDEVARNLKLVKPHYNEAEDRFELPR